MAAAGAVIVLAEDNAGLRNLLAAALERDGHRVVAAATGAPLVQTVRSLVDAGAAPRLIITDVRATLPELGRGSAIPLIFMTAYGDAWTRARAAEYGAVLLDKPLSLGILRQVVRRMLDR